jgi:hypothetical protein
VARPFRTWPSPLSGTINASFRAVTRPARQLPDVVKAARGLDEPVQVVTGSTDEFAAAHGHARAGRAPDLDAPHRHRN